MGRYEGIPVLTFLDDGRRVRLTEDFAFVDSSDARWDVPKGATVDGASIPRSLWSLIGGPFEGLYRNASIIHDWYCDLRSRPWHVVHRMFYEAMITSGVGGKLAKLMYAGVYMGGPRWSKTVVSNVELMAEEYLKDSHPGSRRVHEPMPADEFGRPAPRGGRSYVEERYFEKIKVYRYDIRAAEFERLRAFVSDDKSIQDIDYFVDNETRGIPEITIRNSIEKIEKT
jgi:Protein of unknown function (DUF1353)